MQAKMEEQEGSARGGSGSNKRERLIEVMAPYILCVISNFLLAGLIIVTKVSLDKGFSPYVLVPYSQAFGALTTGVLALLFERFLSIFPLFYSSFLIILGTNLLLHQFLVLINMLLFAFFNLVGFKKFLQLTTFKLRELKLQLIKLRGYNLNFCQNIFNSLRAVFKKCMNPNLGYVL